MDDNGFVVPRVSLALCQSPVKVEAFRALDFDVYPRQTDHIGRIFPAVVLNAPPRIVAVFTEAGSKFPLSSFSFFP
jgi:hypothetical protein